MDYSDMAACQRRYEYERVSRLARARWILTAKAFAAGCIALAVGVGAAQVLFF